MLRYIECKSERDIRFDVCGQLVNSDGFLHMKRTFDITVLIIVTEGTFYITSNNVSYTVHEGQCIFLRAGEEHYGTIPSKGRLSYLWVHFYGDTDFITEDKPGSEFAWCFPEYFKLVDFGRAVQLFNILMNISFDESSQTQLMTDYALKLLLMEITRQSNEQNVNNVPSNIVSAMAWIKNHYYRHFDVTELADYIGYNADYLSTVFKKHTGFSVIQYTNKIRIKAAKIFLSDFGTSVKETAYSCGFTDDKYFIRVFKQYEGITPSEYRKTLGRKNIN